jgi:hypothetical protein
MPNETAVPIAPASDALRQQIDPKASACPGETNEEKYDAPTATAALIEKVTTCEVFKAVMAKTMTFLSRYQYDLGTRTGTQEQHAHDGGSALCTRGTANDSRRLAEFARLILQGLQILVGHRNVNGVFTVRDIL